jgi:hypothetical protein
LPQNIMINVWSSSLSRGSSFMTKVYQSIVDKKGFISTEPVGWV